MEEIIPNKTKKLEKRYPPPVGLEPTTFELEVRHASPLRHGGDTSLYLCNRSKILIKLDIFYSGVAKYLQFFHQ